MFAGPMPSSAAISVNEVRGNPRGENALPPLPGFARASLESFPVRTGRFMELTEVYSAANAGRNSGCSAEFGCTLSAVGLIRNHAA